MTTKDYIKLNLIAAGFVKNISIEIEQYGINYTYSVHGERWEYNNEDSLYDVDSIDEMENDGVIDIQYEDSLLDVIKEIMKKYKDTPYFLNVFSIKDMLDDDVREKYIKGEEQRDKDMNEYLEKMLPVDKYIEASNPCNKLPDCAGDFDDSDTCHGFWKCSHQYHNNCPLVNEHRELSKELREAYKKYVYHEEISNKEMELLKKHNLVNTNKEAEK